MAAYNYELISEWRDIESKLQLACLIGGLLVQE